MAAQWTDREKRLYDALNHAIDYIGDGCPDEGYPAVMAEARAAMKDMHIVKDSVLRLDHLQEGSHVTHATRGRGIVRAIKDDAAHIEFDDYPGKVSAIFDRNWFRACPDTLSLSILPAGE